MAKDVSSGISPAEFAAAAERIKRAFPTCQECAAALKALPPPSPLERAMLAAAIRKIDERPWYDRLWRWVMGNTTQMSHAEFARWRRSL